MSAYRILYASDDEGWSQWIWPDTTTLIRMACCDCGLVHDIDVSVHRITREGESTFDAEDRPARGHRVRWRWRANHRATAQVRRHMKRRA